MAQKSYYTYRIRIANRSTVQIEKSNPAGDSLGMPSGKFGYKGRLKKEIDTLLERVQTREISGDEIKVLGEALFRTLFDDGLRADFVSFYHEVIQHQRELLRLELDVDERELADIAALPWEFMRLPADAGLGNVWLATAPNLVFSRRRSQWFASPPIQLGKDEPLRIALAVAAPEELAPVEYAKVWGALEKLAEQSARDIVLLPLVHPASPENIDAVLQQKPHIFHFIGHGRFHNAEDQAVGQLALTDEWGEAIWVDADYFSELFNEHQPGVVVLQACETGALSAAQAFVGVASRIVQQNIPVVVSMQYKVSNQTAVRFARRFYEQLLAEHPVDRAAQNGRRAITLDPQQQYNSRDFATPTLFMRVKNGHLFQYPIEDNRDEATTNRIAKPPPILVPLPENPNPKHLRAKISEYYSREEVITIISDMGVDPEEIAGADALKSTVIRAAINHFGRRGQLAAFWAAIQTERPDGDWSLE
ncbi:MAG: CHAT domain-containing protein [Chloroflexota bacterium]